MHYKIDNVFLAGFVTCTRGDKGYYGVYHLTLVYLPVRVRIELVEQGAIGDDGRQ